MIESEEEKGIEESLSVENLSPWMWKGIPRETLAKIGSWLKRPASKPKRADKEAQKILGTYLRGVAKNITPMGVQFSPKAVKNLSKGISEGKFSINEAELIVHSLLELDTFRSIPDESAVMRYRVPFRPPSEHREHIEDANKKLSKIKEGILENLEEGTLEKIFPLISDSFDPLMEICGLGASDSPIKRLFGSDGKAVPVMKEGKFNFSELGQLLQKNLIAHFGGGRPVDAALWLIYHAPRENFEKNFIPFLHDLTNLAWYTIKSDMYNSFRSMMQDKEAGFTEEDMMRFLPMLTIGSHESIKALLPETSAPKLKLLASTLNGHIKEGKDPALFSNLIVNAIANRTLKDLTEENAPDRAAELDSNFSKFLDAPDKEALIKYYEGIPEDHEKIIDYVLSEGGGKEEYKTLEARIRIFKGYKKIQPPE